MRANDRPELSYVAGHDTLATLRFWTQIVGKVRLALAPWLNHSWHVPLYVSATGLTTSPIPYGSKVFEIHFNFNQHALAIEVSDGERRQIALEPRSVADFYRLLMQALVDLEIPASIRAFPCEIEGAVAFSRDLAHTAYDAEYVHRFWRILLQVDRVLKQFRTSFLGKCSPVHFFWGSFDLAVTRFSGRSAQRTWARSPASRPRSCARRTPTR